MSDDFHITHVEKPEESAWGIIGRGVHEFNVAQAGDLGSQRICYALRAADDTIVGGILGEVHWDWFYVDLIWVKGELRRQGFGSSLLAHAEDEARKRGAKKAYLDTFSFQAPEFYELHGYEVFGELEDFPIGHQRFFLRKEL